MRIICPLAGVGKGLQPFTYSKPKAFLKVAGKRLIDFNLIKLMKSFPKRTKICFIIGYKKRQIKEYLNQYYSEYFELEFIEQKPLGYTADEPFFPGLGDAILYAKNFALNDDIFIFLSDRVPLEDYSSILINFHQCKCDGIINVKKVEEPQHYGVVKLDNEGFLTHIVEKPAFPESKIVVSGAYIIGKSIINQFFDLLEIQRKKILENGEVYQITPILDKLIQEGARVKSNEMNGEVLDFGRPESLLKGNRYLLSEIKNQDPVYEDLIKNGMIIDTKIIPPVYIGKNVKIIDSVIGPNVSLGDDLDLEKCILSESVIGDGVRLKKIISSKSIIGDYSVLEDLIKNGISIGDASFITTSNNK